MAPGLLDSGFASLAGFSGSLYAARVLDGGTLGVRGGGSSLRPGIDSIDG
jgi:hypothetical protein